MSIFQRAGSSMWYARVPDEQTGKLRRVSLGTNDQQEAQRRYDDLQRRQWMIEQGLLDVTKERSKGKTLQDAYDRSLKVHFKTPTKLAEAEMRWKCLSRAMQAMKDDPKCDRPLLPETPLNQIDRLLVEDVRVYLLALKVPRGETYYTDATANRVMSLIGKVLTLAEEWGWIAAAPRMPKAKETNRKETLTDAQLHAFWDAIRQTGNPKYLAALDLFIVLHHQGLRLGEVWKPKKNERIQWSQVDLEKGTLTFWEDTTKGRNTFIKPMTPTVKEIMTRRSTMGLESPFDDVGDYAIRAAWQVGKEAIGVEQQRIVRHTLRHTVATRLIERGHSLEVVRMYLGHKSIQTTMKYVHADYRVLQAAAATLEGCVKTVSQDDSQVERNEDAGSEVTAVSD